MDFDQRIQNLTQQINIASREVIIQDRILGQAREKVAELQGRINMLMELQRAKDINQEPALAGKSKQPVPGTRPPGSKPGPKPKRKSVPKPKMRKERTQFRYPTGLRNFCIKNIDKMTNQELVNAANGEFDLDMDYIRLASYLSYNNIKRSKSSSREKDLPKLPPSDY